MLLRAPQRRSPHSSGTTVRMPLVLLGWLRSQRSCCLCPPLPARPAPGPPSPCPGPLCRAHPACGLGAFGPRLTSGQPGVLFLSLQFLPSFKRRPLPFYQWDLHPVPQARGICSPFSPLSPPI